MAERQHGTEVGLVVGRHHHPEVVGKRLTPLQNFLKFMNLLRLQYWLYETGNVAAIGSDNRRRCNLLPLLLDFERLGEPIPQTLSQSLAVNRKGWDPVLALKWLIKIANEFIHVFVADGNTPKGFKMSPPENPPSNPSWQTLFDTFKKFRYGTVAELKVLLLFGYTPSDEIRMRALMNRNRRGPSKPARR